MNEFRDIKFTFKSDPVLKPIEMLWNEVKRAVYARHSENMSELKHFCQEEWPKIPLRQWKCLIEVIDAKGVSPS